jgi:hypothetical protein
MRFGTGVPVRIAFSIRRMNCRRLMPGMVHGLAPGFSSRRGLRMVVFVAVVSFHHGPGVGVGYTFVIHHWFSRDSRFQRLLMYSRIAVSSGWVSCVSKPGITPP